MKGFNKNYGELFNNLPKPGEEKKGKSSLVLSRPVERVVSAAEYWKLIPDPDPNNKMPMLSMKGHYLARNFKACPGDVCRNSAATGPHGLRMPCARGWAMKEKLQPLWDKYNAKQLGEEEAKALFDRNRKAKDFIAQDYFFFSLLNVTPAIAEGDEPVNNFKKCYGDRPNRALDDAECMSCPWKKQCSEGLKIYQARYQDGKGGTNGEQMLALFNNRKRLESVFNTSPNEKGMVESRIVKVTKAGNKLNVKYTFSLLDDVLEIPKNVIAVAWQQAMPMADAVLPHVKATPQQIAQLLAQQDAAAEFEFEAKKGEGAQEDVEAALDGAGLGEPEVASDDDEVADEPATAPVAPQKAQRPSAKLAQHPNPAIRDLAAKAKAAEEPEEEVWDEEEAPAAKAMTIDEARAKAKAEGHKGFPKCYGDAEVHERGAGPCVICQKRHAWLVDACEAAVQAKLAPAFDEE